MGLRPQCIAIGTVRSVPIKPPRLNQVVPVLTNCALSWARLAACSAAALSLARKLAITAMKALQLHHVIRATEARKSPPIVRRRSCGVKSSLSLGCAWGARQSFGSLTLRRIKMAMAAGISPVKNTMRQDNEGSLATAFQRRVKISVTKVAKNSPKGAAV